MNSGTAASTDDTIYANWLPTGVWQGSLSGYYDYGLDIQGSYGYYWSSSAYSAGSAYGLVFGDGGVYPGASIDVDGGSALRCLI